MTWLAAALVLLAGGLFPCLAGLLRSGPVHRLAALQASAVVATVVLLLLAAGFGRPVYADVALLLALLSLAGVLAYARFFGRLL
ncbi:monovalent cation/H+ antiporter complex subunit F [Flindersiella endophytica]